jgi:hypothetical protein
MRRALIRDPVLLLGISLVLLLVAALPLALGLFSAEMQGGDAGFGSGAGELSAAALSSLDRDLQSQRLLPVNGGKPTPCFLALRGLSGGAGALAARTLSLLEPTRDAFASEPPLQGPGGDGFPLLL